MAYWEKVSLFSDFNAQPYRNPDAATSFMGFLFWVLVKGFYLSYHNKETIVRTIDPYDKDSFLGSWKKGFI